MPPGPVSLTVIAVPRSTVSRIVAWSIASFKHSAGGAVGHEAFDRVGVLGEHAGQMINLTVSMVKVVAHALSLATSRGCNPRHGMLAWDIAASREAARETNIARGSDR